MKRNSGLKSWLFANPFPLGTFLGAALLLSPIFALPLLGETAGTSQLQQMDVNSIREQLYNNYDKIKQQIFSEHGVAMNPDGTPNKNAPGYKKAVEKIEPFHKNMMEKAKGYDNVRDEINQKIFKEAGIKPPKTTGTDPKASIGRGIFGDAEGTAQSPQEYDKLVKTLEKNKIPFTKEGDYIHIKGSDTVIHRPASKFNDVAGGSGHQAKVSTQTSGPETAGSASGQKKYQGVGDNVAANDVKGAALDSAKKMQNALNNKPETPYQKAARDQVIAKETNRINEAAGGKPDPSLAKVKEGADPDLDPKLKDPVKETALKQTQESWSKIEKQHQENMAKLDKAIENAKTPAEASNLKSQKIDMTSRHEGTMKTIIDKDGGKALNEMKGQPPSAQGTGKSTVSKPDSTAGTKGTASGSGAKPVSEPPLAKGPAAGEGIRTGERTGGKVLGPDGKPLTPVEGPAKPVLLDANGNPTASKPPPPRKMIGGSFKPDPPAIVGSDGNPISSERPTSSGKGAGQSQVTKEPKPAGTKTVDAKGGPAAGEGTRTIERTGGAKPVSEPPLAKGPAAGEGTRTIEKTGGANPVSEPPLAKGPAAGEGTRTIERTGGANPVSEPPLAKGPAAGEGIRTGERTGGANPVSEPPLAKGPAAGEGIRTGERTGGANPVSEPPLAKGPAAGEGIRTGERTGGANPVSEPPLAKGPAAGEGIRTGERTGGGKSMPERTGEPKGSGASAAGGLEDTLIGKLGVTAELPAGATAARTALNTAGGAVLKGAGVIGLIYAGHEIANNTAEALGAYAGGDNKKALEKGKDAAVDVAVVGVPLVIAAASPTAGVVLAGAGVGVGTYVGTRYVMENTKVGQAIDKGVQGGMLTTYEKGKEVKEKADDFIRGTILGRETNAEKAEKEKQKDVGRLVSDGGLSETKAKEFMDAKEKFNRGEMTTTQFQQISKDIRESRESDKISGLKNSETKTDQKDRSNNQDQEGKKAGMDLAKNTNLTDSYQKNRSDKSNKENQQTQTTAGSTLSEKITAAEARDLKEQSQTTAQGKLAETAISKTQQESAQAQKNDQIEKTTAIGTILVGSLMGGLTSGVAIGLDNTFGTLGRAAGEQGSISTGIKPKPEPMTPPTSAPTSTTSPDPSSTDTSKPTTTDAPTSTATSKPTTTPTPTSTATSKPTTTPTPTSTATSKPITTPAPTSTATSKPITTPAPTSTQPKWTPCKAGNKSPGPEYVCVYEVTCSETPKMRTTDCGEWKLISGSKPDCSAYRSSAEALSASYVSGSMDTSTYKSQMAVLRTKYKDCNEIASAPLKTSGTPTTSTQGSTTPAPLTGQRKMGVWYCSGRDQTGFCHTAECSGPCPPSPKDRNTLPPLPPW